jgi:hypothetical protein
VAVFHTFWAIARNTVQEIFRKPIYVILLALGMGLIAFSPAIAMFTLMEDVKLVIDMGLATQFLMGLVLSVFAASTVVSQEIDARTLATVMSKPVGRFVLVAGKYAGLLVAILAAQYLLTLVLLVTVRVGVPETARYALDWAAVLGLLIPTVVAILAGLYRNYFDRAPFVSTALRAALVAFTVGFAALLVVGKGWRVEWLGRSFLEVEAVSVAKAALLVFLGVTILVGLALAASTRVGVVANIGLCLSVFFLGMVSYHLFGQFADGNLAARAAYTVLPNFQAFWVSEGFIEAHPLVPWSYVGRCALYALCFDAALVMLAALLFEERELV